MIERCLNSVLPWITHWAIVDTGSSDETHNLIASTLGSLPGKLLAVRWSGNFSKHRNQTIALARALLRDHGDARLLFIDADETLVVARPQRFAKMIVERSFISWWVTHEDWCFRKLGIARLRNVGEWVGSTHEHLLLHNVSHGGNRVQRCAELKNGNDGFRSRQSATRKLDQLALKKAVQREEASFRSHFFLGRTYEIQQRYLLAARQFEQAGDVPGISHDERWQALWGTARSLLFVDELSAARTFVAAHRFAPNRSEALVQLAALATIRSCQIEAVTLSICALNCSEPRSTSMYDRAAYRWKAADELCIAAFALHDVVSINLAIHHYRKLLSEKLVPENQVQRILTNLQLLVSRLHQSQKTGVATPRKIGKPSANP